MRTSMSDVAYDMERAGRLAPHLSGSEYWTRCGDHLDKIEAGADMALRRVLMLDSKPAFDTRARADLDALEGTLERALEKCRAAKAAYDAKPQQVR